MDAKFRQLIELGAGQFEHIAPSTIAHLEDTRCILKSWSANQALLDAALYHLAYQQDFAPEIICNQTQRHEVAAIVGPETESIIYHFHVCDWQRFFAEHPDATRLVFYPLSDLPQAVVSNELRTQLCELFAAKEIEQFMASRQYAQKNEPRLNQCFGQIIDDLGVAAKRKVHQLFSVS